MWIGFEVYKDTGIKLNGWLIDKGQWIVVRGDLFLLKLTGFNNLWKYTTVTNQCQKLSQTWTHCIWYKVDDITGKKRFIF